jgi:hypothetical protein
MREISQIANYHWLASTVPRGWMEWRGPPPHRFRGLALFSGSRPRKFYMHVQILQENIQSTVERRK